MSVEDLERRADLDREIDGAISGRCSVCGKQAERLYAEDDCGDCMEKRHAEVNSRLLSEAIEDAMWEEDAP